MPSSPNTARDEMFAKFTDEFVNLPKPCAIRYQGKIEPEPRGYYVRLSTQEVMSDQTAFLMPQEPDESPHVFTTTGLFYAQLFAPITERDAFHFGGLLASIARDIFRSTGTASGVSFYRARRVELPFRANDKEYRWNIVVEFEYDERKFVKSLDEQANSAADWKAIEW